MIFDISSTLKSFFRSVKKQYFLTKKTKACNITLWGRTGFDLESYARLQVEDDGWPLKTSIKKLNANDNVDMGMALSVAEADEILAKFGYVEDEALSPVA